MEATASAMISDETFPQELQIDDEESEIFQSITSTRSLENLNCYFSAENSDNSNNSAEVHHSFIESSTIGLLIQSSAQDFGRMTNLDGDPSDSKRQLPEASFKSIDESARRLLKIPPPRAPTKKRKSYSCHELNLNGRKNVTSNYDHVESKVKKLIQNLAPNEDTNRRKSFSRTKSMPACDMQAREQIDDKIDDPDASVIDLKREIRRNKIKIYELEEKVDAKESKIHELQLEKAKMRMTYDDLREQIEKLKDVETRYNEMRLLSPTKSQKSVFIQTEIKNQAQNQQLLPRHLSFNRAENSSIHDFSINTSSDNLIPIESGIMSAPNDTDIYVTAVPEQTLSTTSTTTGDKKKKKKKFKFFKLMQCISGKTQE